MNDGNGCVTNAANLIISCLYRTHASEQILPFASQYEANACAFRCALEKDLQI